MLRTSLLTLTACMASLIPPSVLSGCAKSCTHVGCFDVIAVELEPAVVSDYDAEVAWDGFMEAFRCARGADGRWRVDEETGGTPPLFCDGSGFQLEIRDELPSLVEVAVTTLTEDWTGSTAAMPVYRAIFPNGPDCPGRCDRGSITLMQDDPGLAN